ncbi:unnamed protein product, partial [Nesidiocoris tenuis]
MRELYFHFGQELIHHRRSRHYQGHISFFPSASYVTSGGERQCEVFEAELEKELLNNGRGNGFAGKRDGPSRAAE